ncbi:MAG: Ig domain-containing protein [Candidatus Ornithomonoglobus sp.]
MKTKKLLSLITAAAISASCFVGMAVSASAEGEISAETTWDMSTWAGADITETTTKDGLTYYGTGTYDATATTFGDVKYTARIKLGGKSTFQSNKTFSRVFEFTPSVAGNVKVYVTSGGSGTRTAYISQSVTTTALDTSTAISGTTGQTVSGVEGQTDNKAVVMTADVTENKPTYIWADNNVGVYAITFTPSSSGGGTNPDPDPEPAEVSVSLDQTALSLYTKESKTLTATVTGATDTSVTWSTENKDIAEVTNGVVKGGAIVGETTITATSVEDPTKSATCTVTVIQAPSLAGTAGTVENLVAATETTTYNFLTEVTSNVSPLISENAVYNADNLYFNNEVYVVGGMGYNGLLYYSNKTTSNLDGTTQKGGIRLKAGQDVFAVKLAAGATIEVPVYGGGGSDRYAQAATDSAFTDVVAITASIGTTNGSNPLTLSYTNETGAEQVVYITATGDSFFSQVKVTVPEAPAPTSLTGTVTALEDGTFSGDAYEGAAKAFTVSFSPEGKTITAVKVASASDENLYEEKTGLSITTTGGIVFGIITTNTAATADSYVVTATIE